MKTYNGYFTCLDDIRFEYCPDLNADCDMQTEFESPVGKDIDVIYAIEGNDPKSKDNELIVLFIQNGKLYRHRRSNAMLHFDTDWHPEEIGCYRIIYDETEFYDKEHKNRDFFRNYIGVSIAEKQNLIEYIKKHPEIDFGAYYNDSSTLSNDENVYIGFIHNKKELANRFRLSMPLGDDVQIIYCEYDFSVDQTAFVLCWFQDKLWEINASHCSCYGLEDQWEPMENDYDGILARPNVPVLAKENLIRFYKANKLIK